MFSVRNGTTALQESVRSEKDTFSPCCLLKKTTKISQNFSNHFTNHATDNKPYNKRLANFIVVLIQRLPQ